MKLELIKSYSAPERVVKQFLSNLEAGEMQPGQKLPTQDQLSHLFGVSRSSIREAMNALAMMGYLEITQGRGSFIKKELPINTISTANLIEFFEKANQSNLMEIRNVLECYAVEKASTVASEENLTLLKEAVRKLEESENDLSAFISADLEFHIAIGRSANLPELSELVEGIHRTVNKKSPVAFSASKKEKLRKSIETAKNVLTYIIRGEGRAAARCMRNHLSTVDDDLKNELMQKQCQEALS